MTKEHIQWSLHSIDSTKTFNASRFKNSPQLLPYTEMINPASIYATPPTTVFLWHDTFDNAHKAFGSIPGSHFSILLWALSLQWLRQWSRIALLLEYFTVTNTGKSAMVTSFGSTAHTPSHHIVVSGKVLSNYQRLLCRCAFMQKKLAVSCHDCGNILLTASPRRWAISTYISLFTVYHSGKNSQQTRPWATPVCSTNHYWHSHSHVMSHVDLHYLQCPLTIHFFRRS
jgi:hypothetical protein